MIKELGAILLAAAISVPLVSPNQLGSDTIRVPQTFEGKNSTQWAVIEYKLSSHRYKEITLLWQGYGGLVAMGEDFIDIMVKAESQGVNVHIIIDGFSASMHAVVPCYSTTTTLLPSGTLYYHHIFYTDPNGHKIYASDPATMLVQEAQLTQCVKAGLLRPEGVNAVMTFHAYVERLDPFSNVIIGSEEMDQS